MKVEIEKTTYHSYAFTFKFNTDVLEFCRSLKEKYGWKEFAWNENKWRFHDDRIAFEIKKKYPYTEIPKELEENKRIADTAIMIKAMMNTDFEVKNIKHDAGELFPYQKVGVQFFVNNKGRAILADQMGIGKSVQALAYVAHEEVKKTLVICPASVKYNWENEVKKWTHLSSFVIDGDSKLKDIPKSIDVVIINYDLLHKFFDGLSKIKFECLIIDEFHCFPYETEVMTNIGLLKIGDIVEGKMSLSVLSCNLSNNELEYKKINNYFKNLSPFKMVKIIHEYGEIICTENHKIWTTSGFKEAIHLSSGEELSILQEDVSYEKEGKDNRKTLLSFLQWEICKYASSNNSSSSKEQETFSKKKMSNLFCGFLYKITRYSIGKKTFLWNILFSKMENESSTYKGETTRNNKNSTESEYWNKKTKSLGENEKNEQRSGVYKKIKSWTKKMVGRTSFIFKTWRKWYDNKTTKNVNGTNWSKDGIFNTNRRCKESIRMLAKSLFCRFSLCREKSSNRGGWLNSQDKEMEILRQKKNGGIRISRVVSIEILERGDSGESRFNSTENKFVYNLEIDSNNNYFAEGVLVSNCIKNSRARRSKLTKLLAKNIKSNILLSGTPLLSRPNELFNGLAMMDANVWNNYYMYATKYCAAFNDRFGWNDKGASNMEELQGRISRYFLRRTKAQVLKELPEKRFINIPVKLSDQMRQEYNMAENDFIDYLYDVQGKDEEGVEKSMRAEGLVKLGYLRQITTRGKKQESEDLIRDIVDSGEKVVVFSCYNEPLEQLHNIFKNESVLLIGSVDAKERQSIVEDFQLNPNKKIFFGGIKSAGIGITLTAATNVVFLDYSFLPSDHAQAIDRIHRIGSTSESIAIYQLYVNNTIDNVIRELLVKKQDIFDQLIDGKIIKKKQTSVMSDLLKLMKEESKKRKL